MNFSIPVTTAGTAGSATGTATSIIPLHGYLESVKTKLTGQGGATPTVTITEADGLARTLLTLASMSADGMDSPRYLIQGGDGADIAANYTRRYINGKITVSVTGADAAANGVVVTIQLTNRGG
jgi:hypothetical protein